MFLWSTGWRPDVFTIKVVGPNSEPWTTLVLMLAVLDICLVYCITSPVLETVDMPIVDLIWYFKARMLNGKLRVTDGIQGFGEVQ